MAWYRDAHLLGKNPIFGPLCISAPQKTLLLARNNIALGFDLNTIYR